MPSKVVSLWRLQMRGKHNVHFPRGRSHGGEGGQPHLMVLLEQSWAPLQRSCELAGGRCQAGVLLHSGQLVAQVWALGCLWACTQRGQALDMGWGLRGEGGRSALLLQSWAQDTGLSLVPSGVDCPPTSQHQLLVLPLLDEDAATSRRRMSQNSWLSVCASGSWAMEKWAWGCRNDYCWWFTVW